MYLFERRKRLESERKRGIPAERCLSSQGTTGTAIGDDPQRRMCPDTCDNSGGRWTRKFLRNSPHTTNIVLPLDQLNVFTTAVLG